ncbi:MAG: hypothetical protein MUE68_09930 [Bacteroidetes bacterium]|jgi:hypothetical protein|nr:hypothetical protein [Bacteroidota bacterium]
MLRFTLLVILRSILAVVLLFALGKMLRRAWTSFWEGLRGPKVERPAPKGKPDRPKVEYRDVQDASFTEEERRP